MKSFLLLAVFTGKTIFGFSQMPPNSVEAPIKTDYLKKSKHQKTAAWILFCGGTGLVIIGGLISLHDNPYSIAWGSERDNPDKSNTGEIIAATGGLAILSGIPLMIASSRNRRKAISLSFKNEKTLQIQNNSLAFKPEKTLPFQNYSLVSRIIPSVSLKIML